MQVCGVFSQCMDDNVVWASTMMSTLFKMPKWRRCTYCKPALGATFREAFLNLLTCARIFTLWTRPRPEPMQLREGGVYSIQYCKWDDPARPGEHREVSATSVGDKSRVADRWLSWCTLCFRCVGPCMKCCFSPFPGVVGIRNKWQWHCTMRMMHWVTSCMYCRI